MYLNKLTLLSVILTFFILSSCQSTEYTPNIWKSDIFNIDTEDGCFKIIEQMMGFQKKRVSIIKLLMYI